MNFYQIPEKDLEEAKHLLMILEMTEFRWTINEILEQPEAMLDAVISLKSIGEKMRSQKREIKKDDS